MPIRVLLASGVFCFAAVWLLAAHTPVPSEDGVSYLWMAQRFAAGAFGQALSTVFPPGYPLLLAPWVAAGLDVERAATLVGAASLALTLVPLLAIVRHLHERAALPAAILWATSPLLLRVAAEAYSEPPFLLLLALGTWRGFCGNWWLVGACAGLAFWIRPEGLVLAASFALVQPKVAWRAAVPAALAVAALAVLRQTAGHDLSPLPLLAFHAARDDLPERGAVLANLLAVPGPWFEAFGLAGALALFAPWRPRREGAVLRGQIALQLAAIVTFVVRRRFFLSSAVPVVALAAAALALWPRRWRGLLLVAAAGLGLTFAWRGRIEPDRAIERTVGAWLRSQRHADDGVVADLPRIAFFAGAPPGLPRRFTGAQLAARIATERPRFVVLTTRDAERLQELAAALAPQFAACELPPDLAAAAEARGFVVFVRR